ncbi:probable cytochrome P450 6a13 isoform X2 [Anoplophora glabripennis]|uniref:probable cytochrome P450 6a13 isoform X2 n=1 Tax=Anoplophora glabripennis TaxID=217634 RepID=UPI00087495EA|nr:probable cytochrome P450 6a13 isoform X2 [Anoplophora glabripennis]
MIYFITFCVGLLYSFYCLKHWALKGIPDLHLKYPFVSLLYLVHGPSVVTKSNMIDHYLEMKSKGYKYAGIATSIRSVLIVKDLKLIRDILVNNKDHFEDRGFHYTDRYEPVIQDIVVLDGRKWKQMRSILNPPVLSKKLKPLFWSILDVTPYLIEAIDDCALEKRDINAKELFACFTTDVITHHCYKVNCYSYRRSSSRFCKCQSDRLSSMGLRTAEKSVSSLLYRTIRKYIKYRETGDYKHINIFSLSFSMQDWSKTQDEPLLLFQIVGKVNLFFYYSFDTSSTTLNFAIYELCRNPDIQEKARDEINDTLERHDHVITWKSLRDMKYLDRVIDETLRLYPPAANLVEICERKGYKLGDTGINISTLTDIVVPLFSLHRDPEYFADPEKFDPERFDGGIQACTMQTKIGLVQILRRFRLSISSKTRLPLRLNPQAFLKCDDTLYINAEKI